MNIMLGWQPHIMSWQECWYAGIQGEAWAGFFEVTPRVLVLGCGFSCARVALCEYFE